MRLISPALLAAARLALCALLAPAYAAGPDLAPNDFGITWHAGGAPQTATVAAPPLLQGGTSRKVHGGAGTFGLALGLTPESPTTEPRAGGAQGAHTIVLTFDKAIAGADVAVTEGTAAPGTPSFDGSDVIVGLTGVANAQYVTIALTNVASADGGTGGSGLVRIGFLEGDVSQNRAVTLSDLLAVNAVLAQTVTAANYPRDVNLSGTLSLADKQLINSHLTQALPPPRAAPTCTITPSQTVSPNTSVLLQLGNCNANGNGAMTYSWNQGSAGGPQVGTLSGYSTPPLAATTTYYATVTAGGLSTTYSTTVTVTSPTSDCSGYSTDNLGDLEFNGVQTDSFNMKGTKVAYGRIVIPNPLPANWAGTTAQISVFESDDGAFWKRMYLSKSACDFTVRTWNYNQGTGANLYVTFGAAAFGSVTVQPGEIWYLNVKNETLFGAPSCPAGRSCNFGVRVYPPI